MTFVELVVALSIGAVILTVSVLSYRAILGGTIGRSIREDVQMPSGAMAGFYGTNANYVSVSRAPSYSAAAMAESLRERFQQDVSTAVAVFCLGRSDRSSIRPTTLTMATNFDARTLTTPEMFRSFLGSAVSGASTLFQPFTGVSTNTGLSTFILNTSTNQSQVNVRAIYETDFVTTSSPAGIYASVRRYQGSVCTDYYHVFYPSGSGSFPVQAAYFERDALAFSGVNDLDRNKRALHRPFYFLWWPDPAKPWLASDLPTEVINSSEPRAGYAGMADRTSFFFVVPAFPAL